VSASSHVFSHVKAGELAAEQRHVDAAYARLAEMREAAQELIRQGYREGRTGTKAALVDRDVMVYRAELRAQALNAAHNELVFGRLDLRGGEGRYIGRLGVRTRDQEPLVIDWRAPAAEPFYRAAPEDPRDVVRRRVLYCVGEKVVDLEDDLLDADAAPADLVVVGDGAFIASLARSRDGQMRDIVATIQREQDEIIRAAVDATVVVRGGPGTGKTAVALHRVAWLFFQYRQRFGARGILVVGPNQRFTSYIERVLPSLGEGAAALRSLGDLVPGTRATRHDPPALARLKGGTRIIRVLRRALTDTPPGAPDRLRLVYRGTVVTLDRGGLDKVRRKLVRGNPRPNRMRAKAVDALVRAAWERYVALVTGAGDPAPPPEEYQEFAADLRDRDEFGRFVRDWWPLRVPAEVLGSLADPDRLRRAGTGVLTDAETDLLAADLRAGDAGAGRTYQDIALLDELDVLLGPFPAAARRRPEPEGDDEDDPFVVDGLDLLTGERGEDVSFREVTTYADRIRRRPRPAEADDGPAEYGHIVVDEAQDLSPMQWRMLYRRGRHATWTVVADAAQSSWEDAGDAAAAMDEALGTRRRLEFELTTNYRNSVEIAELAAGLLRRLSPGTRPPDAVRATGNPPLFVQGADLAGLVRQAVGDLLDRVEGTIGVIVPMRRADEARPWTAGMPDRVQLMGALEAKGLEFDAVVLADPGGIVAESTSGLRTLYVAVTRATQLLTVVEPDATWRADLPVGPTEEVSR
jgi:hypothetical protein